MIDGTKAGAQNEECTTGANPWNQDKHRQETPGDRSDRADRIGIARGVAGVIDVLHSEPDRIWTNEPEQRDRNRENEQHTKQRAIKRSNLDIVEGVERELENRTRQVREQCAPDRSHCGYGIEHPCPGIPVGQAATEPIADRQVGHREADHIGPDEGGIAEKWRDQA